MPIRDACRVLWGTNFENSTTFPYPIAGAVTRRVRREGSKLFQSYTGVEDSHNLGFDYLLSGSLEFIEDRPRTTPTVADGWSGTTGVQAFLDWARDQRPFRFVPSIQTPDFWVDKCALVEPIDSDPEIGDDVTRRLDFTFRTQSMDFGWALRGVALELGPGLVYGSGVRPRLEQQSAAGTYHSRAGKVASGSANAPRTRHHYPRRDRNDIAYSEELNQAVWVKTDTTVTADVAIAPDGLTSADKVIENTAVGVAHAIFSPTVVTLAGEYVFASLFLKAAERSAVRCHLLNNISTLGWRFNVNLVARTVTTNTLGGSNGTIVRGPFLTDEGNGWFKLSVIASIDSTVTTAFWNVHLEQSPGVNIYTGDGTSGMFVWGGQIGRSNTTVAQSAPQLMGYVRSGSTPPYFAPLPPTQAWLMGSAGANDALWAEEWNRTGGAPYIATNVTVTTDAITAPDNTVSAEKLVETVAAGVHGEEQALTITAGEFIYGSCFVKAGERNRGRLRFTAGGLGDLSLTVNLSAGTITSFGASGSAVLSWVRLTPMGDGWYRLEISGHMESAQTSTSLGFFMHDAAGAESYTGDGTSGLYVWGLQIVRTGSTTAPAPSFAYRKTTVAASTLAVDITELDWPWPSQSLWGYAKFVEEGEAKRASFVSLFTLGQLVGGTAPLVRLMTGVSTNGANPFWRFNWFDGAATSAAILATTPLPGDTVELFFRLLANGSAEIVQTINGGAEAKATGSGGAAPAATQDLGRRLRLAGAHAGLITLKIGFAPWITTMAQARYA